MSLPAARVVRKGGIAVVPPPVPWAQRLAAAEAGMGQRTRATLAAIVGLWPVTAVLALAASLLAMAAISGSP
ncbi:MAG TPA: hypothetical protein VHE35_06435 [Kofleriaceae bacterium]|nr:hypothetical protein [Kofleriaceae bacterium]